MFLVLDVKSQFYIIKSNICLCVSQGDRLSVEILSLSFNRSSSVALDQSVHQVYVEYRLLGIPMETTETPMSLRKPTDGEEIHYNFTRGRSQKRNYPCVSFNITLCRPNHIGPNVHLTCISCILKIS